MEFEWNILPEFNSLQLSEKGNGLLYRLGDTRKFQRKYSIYVDVQRHFRGTKDNEEECVVNARLVSLYARRFGKGQWSFIGPGSEKKWYSIKEDSPQGNWDEIAERMLYFAESGCPIFRGTTPFPEVKSKARDMVNLRYTLQPTRKRLRFSRIIVSAIQLSLYGAVAEICEGYEFPPERTVRPVVMGQSIVLSSIKTEVFFDSDDDPANQKFLLQQYWERIGKLSQQDTLSKFCVDAGCESVVENGQYFMTIDTGDLTQF